MAGPDQFYDNVSKEWLQWNPFNDQSRHVFVRGLGDQALHAITALGTCGDPRQDGYSSHRTDVLFPTLEEHGISLDKVKNPEVTDWDVSRAKVESLWGARSKVLTIPVTKQTAGAASIAEAGLLTYGGILRGQQVFTMIETGPDAPEETAVARELALTLLRATEARFPLFTISPNLHIMSHQAAVAFSKLDRAKRGAVDISTNYQLPPLDSSIRPEIYLSGSAGKGIPDWMKAIRSRIKTLKKDAPVDDSYREDWNPTRHIPEELEKKLKSAVQIQVVAGDTEALGALAETGARIMHADLSGQSYGVLIEPNYEGDTPQRKDSNRARALVIEHLARLKEDFPSTPVFVTRSLPDLALFAAGQYVQKKERLAMSR
jgi:hypothetical protein